MSLMPPLAEALRGGRAEFNRRFAEAQHRYPGLDAQAFTALLAGPVDRMIARVAGVDPGAVAATVDSVYDIGISLLAQRWIGPNGRAPGIVELWLAVAEAAPQHLAQAPTRLLAGLANAMVHWWAQGGGEPWAHAMTRLAARARGPEELLRAGQVAAWRMGMAHYRESALERLRSLDRELGALALDVALGAWDEGIYAQLQQDRWFQPGAMQDRQQAAFERQVGAFIGFGGRFSEPPVVAARAGVLIFQSGSERYQLYADAYGATLHALVEAPIRAAIRLPAGFALDGPMLTGPGLQLALADRGVVTSAAASGDTLVLTHAWSHAATLISLPRT